MVTSLSTTWIIRYPEKPNYDKTLNYFEDLKDDFLELEVDTHPQYMNTYLITLTYPVHQADAYALRIMQYCAMVQEYLKLISYN